MPTGRMEPATADAWFGITKACAGAPSGHIVAGRARIPTGRVEQAAHDRSSGTTEACVNDLIVRQALFDSPHC